MMVLVTGTKIMATLNQHSTNKKWMFVINNSSELKVHLLDARTLGPSVLVTWEVIGQMRKTVWHLEVFKHCLECLKYLLNLN